MRKKCMAIKMKAACEYQYVDSIKRGYLKLTKKNSFKNINDKANSNFTACV